MREENNQARWLAGRLRELRDAAKVTNAALAREARVTEQSAGAWFKTGRISKTSLARIAPLLGVSVSEILSPGTTTGGKQELTTPERLLLQAFRQLLAHQQKEALAKMQSDAAHNRALFDELRERYTDDQEPALPRPATTVPTAHRPTKTKH